MEGELLGVRGFNSWGWRGEGFTGVRRLRNAVRARVFENAYEQGTLVSLTPSPGGRQAPTFGPFVHLVHILRHGHHQSNAPGPGSLSRGRSEVVQGVIEREILKIWQASLVATPGKVVETMFSTRSNNDI